MEETIQKLARTSTVIPFYKIVAAGFPSPAQDYSEPEIDLSKVLQPNPTTTYIIRIKGDSMREANMPDGCLAVVDRSIKPYSGAIIVAVLNGEFTVKRLVKAGRNWVLHPENPFYKPMLISEDADFQVWGVITHTIIDQK
jgi:DNA polymerase V